MRIGKTQLADKTRPTAPLDQKDRPTPNSKFARLSAPRIKLTEMPKFRFPRETCGVTNSTIAKQQAKTNDETNTEVESAFVFPSAIANPARAMSTAIAGMAGRMYPGNFDLEIVKKTRHKRAQDKKKRAFGDNCFTRTNFADPTIKDHTARAVQGRRATSRTAP